MLHFLILLPLALMFLFFWQGHALPLVVLQCIFVPFLFLIYHASLRSAAKNGSPRVRLTQKMYLPLKINLVLYFAVGVPVLLIFSNNLHALYAALGIQTAAFAFTCYSGMLYVSRSGGAAQRS